MLKRIEYIQRVLKTQFMEWMARRASKEQKNALDRWIIALLNKAVSTKHLENDYMADEWLESEPGFTLEELEAFENNEQ
ncbi:MAG: hypothetical protein AAFV80_05855 [Bacteroidota bacterium]